MSNILNQSLPCKQCTLDLCPYQYSQSSVQQEWRNQYHIKFLFRFIFNDSRTPQKKSYTKSQSAKVSVSKKSFIMTLLHPHHPVHSLSLVVDSLARYHLLMSFSNSNPYPHNYPRYIRSIYVQINTTKVCFVLNTIKS